MKQQNYDNHTRWYIPHHFIFYPFLLVAIALSMYCGLRHPQTRLIWMAITGVFLFVMWLSFMVRQHYALGNQNRIVRLEVRLRYYILTHQPFEPLEEKLTFGQIAALRFAPDNELAALVHRTIEEKLSADDIKKSIKNWLPDYMRL